MENSNEFYVQDHLGIRRLRVALEPAARGYKIVSYKYAPSSSDDNSMVYQDDYGSKAEAEEDFGRRQRQEAERQAARKAKPKR